MKVISHHGFVRNMSETDRAVSVAAGAGLVVLGLAKRSALARALLVPGLELMRRGVTGRSFLYEVLGIRTAPVGQGASVSVPYELGIRADAWVTIRRPRPDVYRFWRNLENLPHCIPHLESVQSADGRSHWVAKGPGGFRVEWDAHLIQDVQDEMLSWRSVKPADVDHAGSVHFEDAPEGTRVRVELQYNPPGGMAGAFAAKLFGGEPQQQIEAGLERLKQLLEAGVPA